MDSAGNLFAQTIRGGMKSGEYVTSSSNSRIRVLSSYLIGAAWCIAMGDDSIEDPVEGAAEKYRDLGHLCKFYRVCEDNFSFCSHLWKKDGSVEPESWARTLFRLLNQIGTKAELESHLEQFRYEMRHSPRLADMEELLTELDWINVAVRS